MNLLRFRSSRGVVGHRLARAGRIGLDLFDQIMDRQPEYFDVGVLASRKMQMGALREAVGPWRVVPDVAVRVRSRTDAFFDPGPS